MHTSCRDAGQVRCSGPLRLLLVKVHQSIFLDKALIPTSCSIGCPAESGNISIKKLENVCFVAQCIFLTFKKSSLEELIKLTSWGKKSFYCFFSLVVYFCLAGREDALILLLWYLSRYIIYSLVLLCVKGTSCQGNQTLPASVISKNYSTDYIRTMSP